MASLLDRLNAWLPRKRRPVLQAVEPCPQSEAAQRRNLPPMSIAAWLGEDESVWIRYWRYPADPAENDPRASAVAVGLCCTSPIWWSMTARQREVFMTLLNLQWECGLQSLLPNVAAELLWLAQRPWWDARVADIEAEGVD